MNINQIKTMQRVVNVVFKALRADVPEVVFAGVQKDALFVKLNVKSFVFLTVVKNLKKSSTPNLLKELLDELNEVLQYALKSHIEEEYKAMVERIIFFEGVYTEKEDSVYFVVFFKKNLPGLQNIHAKEEDKTKREISKIVVETTRRKVVENKVYIFPENKQVYIFKDLFTDYERKLLLTDAVAEKKTNEITNATYREILHAYCRLKDFDCEPNVKFTVKTNIVAGFVDFNMKR